MSGENTMPLFEEPKLCQECDRYAESCEYNVRRALGLALAGFRPKKCLLTCDPATDEIPF